MWPFKDKTVEQPVEQPVEAKPKKLVPVKVLAYKEPQQINVGKTTIKIKLKDGKYFEEVIYGRVLQDVREHGFTYPYHAQGKWVDAIVDPIFISASTHEAMLRIVLLNGNGADTFKNLPYPHTTEVCCGVPVSAKIKKTEEYFIEMPNPYLEEKMLEE